MSVDDEIKERIAMRLEVAKRDIQNNMEREGVNASMRTSKSFVVRSYDKGVMLIGGGKGAAPIPTLEVGSSDGARGEWFTSVIRQWMIDKGLSVEPKPYKRKPSGKWSPKYTEEERSLNMAAGAIAYNIIKYGTKRYQNNINSIYSPVVEELKKEIASDVKAVLLKAIKVNK